MGAGVAASEVIQTPDRVHSSPYSDEEVVFPLPFTP